MFVPLSHCHCPVTSIPVVVVLCHSDDDKQRIGRCLSFGCHVALSDMAPGVVWDYRNGGGVVVFSWVGASVW